MLINKAYKFKLLPTKKQVKILSSWTGVCRFIYNAGLEHRIIMWQKYRKGITYYHQQNSLPDAKKMEGFDWLKAPPSQSVQYALRNLDTAFKNFFQGRASFPQYKKKGINDSITFPQGERLVIQKYSKKKSLAELPKFGKIKFRKHREIAGKIKSATIRKESGEWYISFICETQIEETSNYNSYIGIDKGITKTLAFSNGEYINLPVENIKILENHIEKLQRRMSKEIRFSDSWRKYNNIINKLHSKISRIRQNWLHIQSYNLANNHGVIVVEDLKVKNMSKSAKGTIDNPGKNVKAKSGLNRSILRQGWGMLTDMLEYKSLWYGSKLVKVSPQYTSQQCKCGFVSKDNRVTQELFRCQKCGHEENADINAAKNILRLGLESLGITLEAPAIA
jgi:putative transposase